MAEDLPKYNVFTLPSGIPFLETLAHTLLNKADHHDPFMLARTHIFLPTRRACRLLRDCFALENGQKPLLLPKLIPIGDVDENELLFMPEDMGPLPALLPALHPIRRRFLLMRLIRQKEGGNISLDHLIALADALARLMDQVYTEDLDLKNLPNAIDTDEFSAHWQISVNFLGILSEHWPRILNEQGVMDAADRRNRLVKALAGHWQSTPPDYPVMAAGSTGSIPATALLLKTIAAMPKGAVILPALDQGLDEESWATLDQTHPQATLKNFLAGLGLSPQDVGVWPHNDTTNQSQKCRVKLVREIMRPAQTCHHWQTLSQGDFEIKTPLGVERYECATQQEEAMVISLGILRALQDPKKTIAVVTPDRALAQRLISLLQRWATPIDDSGGIPLSQTPCGHFLLLCLSAVLRNFRPLALTDLAGHRLCRPAHFEGDWMDTIHTLNRDYLRGIWGHDSLASAKHAFAARGAQDTIIAALSSLEDGAKDFHTLMIDGKGHPLSTWVMAHESMMRSLIDKTAFGNAQEQAAITDFLLSLREEGDAAFTLTLDDYALFFKNALAQAAFRPTRPTGARVTLLGQLEARMTACDVVFISGMNEGAWPPESPVDPWMSRPMRKKFGLPSLERSVGLSAHDFSQLFCAPHVIITRTTRVDGEPKTPSRWLLRLDAVLSAPALARHAQAYSLKGDLLAWARGIDGLNLPYAPIEQPAPTPALERRPWRLSVTDIARWFEDPYTLYAKVILKLSPLEIMEKPFEARDIGTALHKAFKQFIESYRSTTPLYADEVLYTLLLTSLREGSISKADQNSYAPLLQRMITTFLSLEDQSRQTYNPAPLGLEVEGVYQFMVAGKEFTLKAKADRIDCDHTGRTARILDYKTGAADYTETKIKNAQHPQLPLEGLILENGGFQEIKNYPVADLSYWIISPSKSAKTEITCRDEEARAAIDTAKERLVQMITLFDDPAIPYRCLAYGDKDQKYYDYAHFARVREWSDTDISSDAGDV